VCLDNHIHPHTSTLLPLPHRRPVFNVSLFKIGEATVVLVQHSVTRWRQLDHRHDQFISSSPTPSLNLSYSELVVKHISTEHRSRLFSLRPSTSPTDLVLSGQEDGGHKLERHAPPDRKYVSLWFAVTYYSPVLGFFSLYIALTLLLSHLSSLGEAFTYAHIPAHIPPRSSSLVPSVQSL